MVLVVGALLAPGKRTVSACLRVTEWAMCETYSSYHQVLNRARWDPRDLSRRLVLVLVVLLAGQGPIVIGLDGTIERILPSGPAHSRAPIPVNADASTT